MSNVEYKDIIESVYVETWFSELAKKEPLAFAAIIGNNKDKFIELFGKPNGEKNGFIYWQIQEQGLYFLILTGEQGSYYKIKYFDKNINNDSKTGSYLITFLKKILDNLSRN